MKVFLIRHARTVWNDERRIQGWADIEPYEEAIRIFYERMKTINEKPDVIFSSDLKRALISAEIIKRIYGDVPIFIDWRLRERNMGKVEGELYEEIKGKYPELWGTVDVRPEGGESVLDMADRLRRFANDFIWFSNINGWKVAFIVSHQLAIEVLRRIFLNKDIDETIWNNLIGSAQWIELELS